MATINGSILTMHRVGLAIITASQPGNDQYLAAPNVMKILQVTEPVGIPNLAEESITVYPNPTNNIVNVQCTTHNSLITHIHVFDAYGKLVGVVETFHETSLQTGKSGSSAQTAQIDLSPFAPGVFFIKAVTDGKTVAVRKIVKQ